MKNSRRNFYRILQVQPDAPLDTIKNNYRTLLHKLRLHPDLGGENDTASSINLAYATLRNPVKRSAYDRKLLNQYKIEALSKGHLSNTNSSDRATIDIPVIESSNQRNYYRILHIQPDAPTAIIFSSYQMLVKQQSASVELIKEAYSVLSIPQKRKLYDQFLKQGKHINASMLKSSLLGTEETSSKNKKNTNRQRHVKMKSRHPKRYGSNSSPYQPLITHYCHFCKTPQNLSAIEYVDDLCIECSSPLNSSRENLSMPRRFFSRIEMTSSIDFYVYWPGKKVSASLLNLSPTGLQFTSKLSFNKDQVIKIDANHFQAVGQVKHQKVAGSYNMIGVEFITIQFNTHKGTFVSASA